MPYKTALDVLNECNKRIDKSPQDWQAYYQRSRSQQILSNYKASIEDTDILIENKKLLNLAYWNQGLSYIYLLDYTKAIEVYKKALNYYNDPYTKARINFFIGLCYIKIDNEEQGCIYFKKLGKYRSYSGFEQLEKHCQ